MGPGPYPWPLDQKMDLLQIGLHSPVTIHIEIHVFAGTKFKSAVCCNCYCVLVFGDINRLSNVCYQNIFRHYHSKKF